MDKELMKELIERLAEELEKISSDGNWVTKQTVIKTTHDILFNMIKEREQRNFRHPAAKMKHFEPAHIEANAIKVANIDVNTVEAARIQTNAIVASSITPPSYPSKAPSPGPVAPSPLTEEQLKEWYDRFHGTKPPAPAAEPITYSYIAFSWAFMTIGAFLLLSVVGLFGGMWGMSRSDLPLIIGYSFLSSTPYNAIQAGKLWYQRRKERVARMDAEQWMNDQFSKIGKERA